MRVFAIGLPIGIEAADSVSLYVVDHTVVSVGPYMLKISALSASPS